MPIKDPEKRREHHRLYLKKRYEEDEVYRESHKRNVRNYKRNNPDKVLSWRYKGKLKDIQYLVASSDGYCEICGRKERLQIDHDHETGKIRGLLCITCNTGLGKLGDSVTLIKKALTYLEKDR